VLVCCVCVVWEVYTFEHMLLLESSDLFKEQSEIYALDLSIWILLYWNNHCIVEFLEESISVNILQHHS
jgi:hypothetical protein